MTREPKTNLWERHFGALRTAHDLELLAEVERTIEPEALVERTIEVEELMRIEIAKTFRRPADLAAD